MKNKSKYGSLDEWKQACPREYTSAYAQNFIPRICEYYGWSHSIMVRNKKGHWDVKENVLLSARQHSFRKKWGVSSSAAVGAARRNGWYEEATAHMEMTVKPAGHWNIKENVLKEAKKWDYKEDFKFKSSSANTSARQNGWYEEATAHMVITRKPKGYWDIKEHVLTEALKYRSRSEFCKKSDTAYSYACKHGWLDEACLHMTTTRKPKGYWTKERCFEEGLKYKTGVEWKKKSSSSHNKVIKNGWYDEFKTLLS